MGEQAQLFPIRRATRWESWFKDSFTGMSIHAGQNPPNGAIIDYWLAAEEEGGVTITITDASGAVVNEVTGPARAGVNRAVWTLTWAEPEGTPANPFAAFFGGSGLPALPGTYTATLTAAGRTMAESFEVRGDPDVGLTMADYEAQFEVGQRVQSLTTSVNELIGTIDDLNEQVSALEGRLQDADIENLEAIVEQTGTATAQLAELQDKLRRPMPMMPYRDYPRLSDELQNLMTGIVGAQARPTEGTYTALEELDVETQERIQELNEIIETTIGELNALLENYPKVMTNWTRGQQ